MKNTAALLATFACVAAMSAQTPAVDSSSAEETAGTWILTASVASQNMFRGTRLGGPSFQPAIEYDKDGLGLGVWANVPLKDKVVGQSDPEFDIYGFYSIEPVKNLTITPGFTLYTYPGAEKTNGFYKLTFEPNIAVTYTIGEIRLTPKLYYDFALKGPTAELTATFAIPLKTLGTELDFIGTAGTFKWTDAAAKSEPAIKNWGDYYLFGVTAPFQISRGSKVAIGWAYTKGSNNYLKQGPAGKSPNPAAVGRGVLTISYTLTF